ncbi:hypothetical protein Tco_0500973, partial [Tanacetum coccineum]
ALPPRTCHLTVATSYLTRCNLVPDTLQPRTESSYLLPVISDMSEDATWQAIIGQPLARVKSGTQMPCDSELSATCQLT